MDQKLKVFQEAYGQSGLEAGLRLLKEVSSSPIEAIRVLRSALGINLSQADQIILNSPSWQKEADKSLKFRNQLGDFLDDHSDDA